ncbi:MULTISPECIES: sulfite exporter TauE/SafE family protein [Lacrimispora]|uniref:Probable membrane transporter protein n=2 Tax=Clostridia TaxID=186801 RepID=A0A084JEZ8_9FIRM|nr:MULTISPECIES: sulfite exporter TauE/SafE family protein [Clostridia]KEZ87532.1 membrane protein [Lacrimispora celerecrescens]MSS11625.1 sulfite exporter TauE/SafE family protein [Clostridium sp. WB02_MRS01]
MSGYLYGLFLLISFGASIAGAICGIGGGVIIKPTLDAFGVLSVSAISFLSGCTVLAMTCYSVIKGKMSGESLVDMKTGTPLAIGAAIGGVVGKSMFQAVSSLFADKDMVGAVQAACLLVITLGTLIYTIKKDKIHTHHVTNSVICVLIGLVLGILSSFLGIGGGPINLVVLFFFFSMDTKAAAQNSLYIILFSQITGLLNSLVTGTVPEFSIWLLVLMVIGGIFGGMSGRVINKRIDEKVVDKLFLSLMVVIIGINLYNIYQFM